MRFFALFRKLRPNMDFHRQARESAAEVKSLVGSIREKREEIRKDFPISSFIQQFPEHRGKGNPDAQLTRHQG